MNFVPGSMGDFMEPEHGGAGTSDVDARLVRISNGVADASENVDDQVLYEQQVLGKWKQDLLAEIDARQAASVEQAVEKALVGFADAFDEVRQSSAEALKQVREAMLLKASLYDLRHQIQENASRTSAVSRDLNILLETIKQQDLQNMSDMQNLQDQVQVVREEVKTVNSMCGQYESNLSCLQSEIINEPHLQEIREGLANQQAQCDWLQNDYEKFRGHTTHFLETELRALHNEIASLQNTGQSNRSSMPDAASEPTPIPTARTSELSYQVPASSAVSELQRHAESRAECILLSFREKQLQERRFAEERARGRAARTEADVPCQEPVVDRCARRPERAQGGWLYEQAPNEHKIVRYASDGEQARRPTTTAQIRGNRLHVPGHAVTSTTRCRQEYEAATLAERQKQDSMNRFPGTASRNRSNSPASKRAVSPRQDPSSLSTRHSSPRTKQPSPGPKTRPFNCGALAPAGGARKASPPRRMGSSPTSSRPSSAGARKTAGESQTR